MFKKSPPTTEIRLEFEEKYDAAIPIYYFDQNTLSCEQTFWGGCGGIVPFWTLSECQQSCINTAVLEDNIKPKSIVKTIDILGRINNVQKGLVVHIYSDNSIKIEYILE